MPIAPVVGAALIGGTAAIGGGVIAARGASKAAKAQRKAAESAAAQQERMFQRQEELQRPFREGGLTAQTELMKLLGLGGDATAPGYGSMTKQFGMDQFQQDPGYAFRQSEGMKALERSAAARGNLLSGSTLKGVQRFGQDLASQEYQNAFNRYQVERAARLNPLQSLMGSGQSAANVMTGAAGNLGQGLAGAEMAAGQARASGYVGQANALAGALGQIGSYAAEMPMRNAIMDYYRNTVPSGSGTPITPRTSTGIGGGPVYSQPANNPFEYNPNRTT
jgi:hypothetical protein